MTMTYILFQTIYIVLMSLVGLALIIPLYMNLYSTFKGLTGNYRFINTIIQNKSIIIKRLIILIIFSFIFTFIPNLFLQFNGSKLSFELLGVSSSVSGDFSPFYRFLSIIFLFCLSIFKSIYQLFFVFTFGVICNYLEILINKSENSHSLIDSSNKQ